MPQLAVKAAKSTLLIKRLHGQANQRTLPPKPSPNPQLLKSVFTRASGVRTWIKNGSSFKAQVYAPSFLQSHMVWGDPECPAADADSAGGDHSVPPASGYGTYLNGPRILHFMAYICIHTSIYIDTYITTR